MRWKLPKYSNNEIKAIILEKIHSKQDRQILYLKLVDGMTIAGISDALKIPYSTVRDHYYDQVKILFEDFPG